MACCLSEPPFPHPKGKEGEFRVFTIEMFFFQIPSKASFLGKKIS